MIDPVAGSRQKAPVRRARRLSPELPWSEDPADLGGRGRGHRRGAVRLARERSRRQPRRPAGDPRRQPPDGARGRDRASTRDEPAGDRLRRRAGRAVRDRGRRARRSSRPWGRSSPPAAIPFVLGGDHSITLPALRACAAKHGPLGLVHFDSHTDTGTEVYEHTDNHGTMMRSARRGGPRRSAPATCRSACAAVLARRGRVRLAGRAAGSRTSPPRTSAPRHRRRGRAAFSTRSAPVPRT